MLTLGLLFLCPPPSWLALEASRVTLVKAMSCWGWRLCCWPLKSDVLGGMFQWGRALASPKRLGAAGPPLSGPTSIQGGLGCPDALLGAQVSSWVPRCPLGCPDGLMGAQTPSWVPRCPLGCPNVLLGAQTPSWVPRCPLGCPNALLGAQTPSWVPKCPLGCPDALLGAQTPSCSILTPHLVAVR